MPPQSDDVAAAGPKDTVGGIAVSRPRNLHVGSFAVVLVIALQIAIPTIALLLPPPQRFGFQMYSGHGGVTIVVVNREGVENILDDADKLVGKLRPELDWLSTLPEAVCEAIPEAATVRAEQSGRERTVECG